MNTPKAKALMKKMKGEDKRDYKQYEKSPVRKSIQRHMKGEVKKMAC